MLSPYMMLNDRAIRTQNAAEELRPFRSGMVVS